MLQILNGGGAMRVMAVATVAGAMLGVWGWAAEPASGLVASSYVLLQEGPDKQDVFLQEVAGFLEKAGHYYLASFDGAGARVRPMRYTMILDNRLVVVTSRKKEMHSQMLAHPEVELSRFSEDMNAYLRLKGRATLSDDPAVKARLLVPCLSIDLL